MVKTVNRGWLYRKMLAGKLVMVGAYSYSYSDMTGTERNEGLMMPVALKPENWQERKEGVAYLTKWEYETKSGRAWLNENGTVTLYVHSNSNYDLRVVE